MLKVFIDESGRPTLVADKRVKRKEKLFVLAGIVANGEAEARLRRLYGDLLDTEVLGGGGVFTLRELFDVYRRVAGKDPELKAGLLVNSEGPFWPLRYAPPEAASAARLTVFEHVLRRVVELATSVYIVVVDKARLAERAEAIERRSGLALNVRVFALDFLLTRLVRAVRVDEILVVHDAVSEWRLIRDYIREGLRRCYIYNPRFTLCPGGDPPSLEVVFVDSRREPLIQLADIVAYAARSLRAGTASPEEARIYRETLMVARPGRVRWVEY